MVCATGVLKPPPVRIGRISGNWTLDRAVRVTTILGVAAGAAAGAVVAVVLLAVGLGVSAAFVSVGLGGGAGYLAVTTSPLEGESMATWLKLTAARANASTATAQGRRRVAVGICILDREPRFREVRGMPGAVPVAPGSVDRRGVAIDRVRVSAPYRQSGGGAGDAK